MTAAAPLVVTVVGAGPFTAALVGALAADGTPEVPMELRLLGRDDAVLGALEILALSLLPGVVLASSDPSVLDGSDVVLVQLRPGGTSARIDDERVAGQLGVAGDESLGLGGLATALRGAPVLRGLADDLAARSPRALVLVLTNPLPTFVHVLGGGDRRVVGACELPTVTAAEVADVLGIASHDLEWAYAGLSHRGFVHGLRLPDGADALALLLDRLRVDGSTLGGVAPDEMAELGAVPLKYHGLLSGAPRKRGRAAAVEAARDDVRAQLLASPQVVPAALAARPTPWYDVMVAPLLRALAGGGAVARVLDLPDVDGLVREQWATVDVDGPHRGVDEGPVPPDAVAGLLASYETQERAWCDLVDHPSLPALEHAVTVDPVVPAAARAAVVTHLAPAVRELGDQPVASHWWRT